MKSNKFVQDAQAQKNREILLKHNRKSLLSSRKPIRACGSDDDEDDDGTSLAIEKQYREPEKLPPQMTDREKEIEELQKKLLQLQEEQEQEQNQSHQLGRIENPYN